MKAKDYVKVGLVISIVLHVGIFALGGYVMNNITKELNEKSMLQSSADEDIKMCIRDRVKEYHTS